MSRSKKALENRLARLEASLQKEQERIIGVMNNIGWGTGMRCTKCTPSYRKEDEIKAKIEKVKAQLAELTD